MKLIGRMITIAGMAAALVSCSDKAAKEDGFRYLMDEFADLKIMRYQVPGWDGLTLQQKEYVYHLAEAAKYGRDIIWMQNCRHNLDVRKTIENILENYEGDRTSEDWKMFETYAKRVFFSNGIHHHYAEDKFFPECSQEYFQSLMAAVGDEAKCAELLPVIFDPAVYPARKLMGGKDIVAESAVNFYEGVTRAEVEAFYAAMVDPSDKTPISYGLNSRVVKGTDGIVVLHFPFGKDEPCRLINMTRAGGQPYFSGKLLPCKGYIFMDAPVSLIHEAPVLHLLKNQGDDMLTLRHPDPGI